MHCGSYGIAVNCFKSISFFVTAQPGWAQPTILARLDAYRQRSGADDECRLLIGLFTESSSLVP